MHEIIYMKAFYEPWWQFDGWEKEVVSRKLFSTAAEAKSFFMEMKDAFAVRYPYQSAKGEAFIAFWTEEEQVFCEACDDDLQTYHGLIWLVDGKPVHFS
ncbi:DUF1033 family protein [Indiicoccus explosivorum]|uniref:DUF1033 family protein n=1 Tax=Indiicoccus explosivorum TaxID=1917864 RepID=UPI000B437F61|nr:DUF1033 family protein [Indiicoccus explosivorum]